jgi:xylulokinase
MESLLGIDLGTSAVKALLVGSDGRLLGEARASVSTHHAAPGWSEQHPDHWWNALAEAITRLDSEHRRALEACRAIGVAGQMHGSVLLDAAGRPRRPAILWNDNRSVAECERLTEALGLPRLLELAGNRAFPGFTAPKIAWLRRHEPDALAGAAHLLLPKDYLIHRLTGGFTTDVSDASGTLLLDVARRDWSPDLCDAWEVDPAWLPPVVESSAVVGVTRGGSSLPGLPVGIPVVAGAGDQAAAAVGVGVTRPGETSVCVGTSGVVFTQSDGHGPDPDGVLHAFAHAVPRSWHLMGVMLSAGGALDWFAREFGGAAGGARGDAFARVTDAAARSAPGAGGVVFLPYLAGERCPHPDPRACGTLHGLRLDTGFAEVARAVLEGIAIGLAECADRVRRAGVRPTRVRVTGGGTRSPLLMSMLASALDTEIEITAIDEGSAYGAALLAGVAAGVAPDPGAMADAWERPGDTFTPEDDSRDALAAARERRHETYRRLADSRE